MSEYAYTLGMFLDGKKLLIVLLFVYLLIEKKHEEMKGISLRKDAKSKIRLRALQRDNATTKAPEGWDKALTPEEFLSEAKNIIRDKFEERNKI